MHIIYPQGTAAESTVGLCRCFIELNFALIWRHTEMALSGFVDFFQKGKVNVKFFWILQVSPEIFLSSK